VRAGSFASRGWAQARWWLSLLVSATVMAACGTSMVQEGSSAACARVPAAKYLAAARVAFIGTMMAGDAVKLGDRPVLLSPAKVRVSRYLKGHGPRIARVRTAAESASAANCEGIEPQAGQRWLIYSPSKTSPYDTSVCAGSRQLRAR
jgi:hypothetical protein